MLEEIGTIHLGTAERMPAMLPSFVGWLAIDDLARLREFSLPFAVLTDKDRELAIAFVEGFADIVRDNHSGSINWLIAQVQERLVGAYQRYETEWNRRAIAIEQALTLIAQDTVQMQARYDEKDTKLDWRKGSYGRLHRYELTISEVMDNLDLRNRDIRLVYALENHVREIE